MKTQNRHACYLTLVLAWILTICASAAFSQTVSDNLSDVQYYREQLHHRQAESLAKSRENYKSLLSQTVTNWQEYDITYYDIDWYPDYASEGISGTVGMYAHATVSLLDSIVVNLLDSLTVDSIYNSSGNLAFIHETDHVIIYLERQYAQEETFGFTVAYKGDNLENAGSGGAAEAGIFFSTYSGTPTIQTLSEPFMARSWWPCNDIPYDKADSFDIRITIDTGLIATSNGLLIDDNDNGDGTHTMHWNSHYPIASYLICLAVGDYISWTDYYVPSPTDSVPIVNYVYFNQYAQGHEAFAITAQAIGIYAGYFGEYPFSLEKYGHTQTVSYLGMEHQMNTFIMPNIDATTAEYVVIHELAHHWWGDLVTCQNWHHIWLNEGFATYSEALYFEALYGPDYYHNHMDAEDYFSDSSIYAYDTTTVWPGIFNNRVYAKGGWVLHMLRHILGDSTFFNTLQSYAELFAYSTATTEDFQAVCESESGLDLDYFFEQWVYGIGRPDLRHTYFSEPASDGGWNTYIILRQVQESDPPVFIAPIDISLKTSAGYELHTLVDSLQEQLFIVHTDYEVTRMMVDPDNWLLDYQDWEHFRIRILYDSIAGGIQYEPYLDSLIIKGGFPGHDFVCEIVSGTIPDGWTLDESTGIISGEALEAGDFSFMILVTDEIYVNDYRDSAVISVHIDPGTPRPGDANMDRDVNVGDAVYTINYIFKYGTPPTVPNFADVNADCAVNVGDAVYLINYIFKGGPEPLMGCVE